jgi:hypothetical protein
MAIAPAAAQWLRKRGTARTGRFPQEPKTRSEYTFKILKMMQYGEQNTTFAAARGRSSHPGPRMTDDVAASRAASAREEREL